MTLLRKNKSRGTFGIGTPENTISSHLEFRGASEGQGPFSRTVDGLQKLVDHSRFGTTRAMQPGRCWLLNGTSDEVTGPNNATAQTDQTMTAWIRTSSAATQYVLSTRNGSLGSLSMFIGSGELNTIIGGTTQLSTASQNIDDGQWHFLAVRYNDTETPTIDKFVDTSKTSNEVTGTPVWTTAQAYKVGNRGGGTFWLDGEVFDVRHYDYALTDEELNRIAAMAPGNQDVGPMDPILWYRCDESTGSTAIDASGNGDDGTITGSVHDSTANSVFSFQNEFGFTDDAGVLKPRIGMTLLDSDGGTVQHVGNCPHDATLYGPSATFDASTQNASTPAILPDANVPNMSVGCWMRKTTTGLTTAMSQYNETAGAWAVDRALLFGTNGNFARMHIGDGGAATFVDSTTVVNDGEWHHVVGTYDQSDTGQEIKLYVNGIEEATAVKASMSGNPVDFVISGFNRSGTSAITNEFNGSLADCQLYTRTLTPTEIADWFAGTTPDATSCEGRWPLSESSGGYFHDLSGNDRHMPVAGSLATLWNATRAQPKSRDSMMQDGVTGATQYSGSGDYYSKGDQLFGQVFNVNLAFWVYFAESGAAEYIIGEYSSPTLRHWRVYKNASDQLVWDARDQTDALSTTTQDATIPIGEWVHVAVVTSFAERPEFYVNGVLEATTDSGSAFLWIPASNDAVFEIGRNSEAGDDFSGMLSGILIEGGGNLVLSPAIKWNAAQVLALSQGTLPAAPDALAGTRYHFKNGDGVDSVQSLTIAATGTPTFLRVPAGIMPVNLGPGLLQGMQKIEFDGGEPDSPYAQQLAVELADLDYAIGDDDEASTQFARVGANGDDRIVISLPPASGAVLAALEAWTT